MFLSFLGILRTKYLKAREKKDLTFKSVILAGVHDIKSLKIGIRDNEEKRYNLPWNIAVNFNIDMKFNIDEIEGMLIEYKNDNSIKMNTKEISSKIYYYTNGYAFLISRLCQIIDEEIYADVDRKDSVWNNEMIKIIEGYRFRPFNDRIAYLEVYTSNKIEGNTLTKGQTKAVLEGIVQDADLRSQTEVVQLNRAIRDNFSIEDDLSIKLILEIHKDITFNTLENSKWEGKIYIYKY